MANAEQEEEEDEAEEVDEAAPCAEAEEGAARATELLAEPLAAAAAAAAEAEAFFNVLSSSYLKCTRRTVSCKLAMILLMMREE
jgi:hypothetical protein